MLVEPRISAADVAKQPGIAKDTVDRWIEKKGLPAHKVGRRWKFKISEVDEWVREGGAAAPDTDGPNELDDER